MHSENSPLRDSQQPDARASAGEPPRPSPEENASASTIGATSGIPVVGLGGSAGALESFRRFLAAVPAESGAAFVVIQHLAPTHESLLTELIAQHTRMRVVTAQDAVPVEANCVYVIPPQKYLGIHDGILSLTEPVLQPIRNMLPQTSGLDFSPMIAIILLQILGQILITMVS